MSILPSPLPCYMVNNVTTSTEEQCKFIIDNDCLEDESTIDYAYLVYCDIGYEFRYLAICLIVFLVVVLFLNLSAVADEFLCPSLLAVAKNLRMSDSLAGVTLLAFGNGCPDIFSSLAAASSGRPELIVGELLGAGIFCTSIVAGLIFIHSDFKLACRPLLRDATFYLLAVYLIWAYCYEEYITFYGSLAFIVIYVIYLIFALGGQAIHSRLKGEYPIAEKHSQVDPKDPHNSKDWFKWREESLRRRSIISCKKEEKSSETSALSSSAYVQYQVNGVTSIHLGSGSLHSAPSSLANQPIAPPNSQLAGGYINGAFEFDCSDSKIKLEKSLSLSTKTEHSVAKLTSIETTNAPAQISFFDEWKEFLVRLTPIDLENWEQMNFSIKVINILRAPLLFCALITVPVVDHDKSRGNWCRILNTLHCITVPATIAMTIRISDEFVGLFGVPLRYWILIPALIVAYLVFNTSSARSPPTYHAAFAYFGFIMSVLWIYLLATEIISLLKTVGVMFSMTDTAVGLGILAWGNSLGDIVSNLTLAEAGYPRMALGASIGAPLLNLLLGFGLSFTLSLSPGDFITIEYSPTITLLCSSLAIILIALMLSTLVRQDRSKKAFGYVLMGGYGVYFALAVCLETGLINL